MVDGAWQQAVADQTAVGLANLQSHAASVAAQLPAGLQPGDPGSTWTAFLAFTGFSAGDTGAANTINRYASSLSGVGESGRVAALIDAVLLDAQNGTLPGPMSGDHGNPAYDVLRTLQKFGAGRTLAQQTGGDVSWFDLGFGANTADAEQGIDDAAYGRSVSGVPSWSTPFDLGGVTGRLLLVGLLGLAGWAGYEAWQRGQLAVVGLPAPRRSVRS